MHDDDTRTRSDRLASLSLTCLMPPYTWTTLRSECRTCATHAMADRGGERWPSLYRDELVGKASMLRCEGGAVVLAMPFDVLAWRELGGCLMHEVRPIWNGYLIGEAYIVQDLSRFRSLEPLDALAHTSPSYGGGRFFDARFFDRLDDDARPR